MPSCWILSLHLLFQLNNNLVKNKIMKKVMLLVLVSTLSLLLSSCYSSQLYVGGMEVDEIIIYHNSIRSYPFGDVGQQPRSAKKIHKNGTVWESVQYFDEFFGKHTFLPHKRKRGRQIHISHVTFHLKKRRKDLLNL